MKNFFALLSVILFFLFVPTEQIFSQVIALDPSFNPPNFKRPPNLNNGNATITSVVQQSDGKIIIGGAIDSVNGLPVKGIVRLNPDGSVDPSFNFNPNSSYVSYGATGAGPKIKLIDGGRMLVQGIYIKIDTSIISRGTDFLCLNSDGSICSSFYLGMQSGGQGFTIQNDGKIMVVGNFSRFYENGNFVNISPGIIRLNPNGTRDLTFQAENGFLNLNSGGYWIDNITALSNGKYLAGGKFANYNGRAVYNIVRINSNGSYDSTFNVGTGFNIQTKKSIELPDGKYLIAGDFDYFNQASAQGIVRLYPNGNRDTSFSSTIPFNQINEMVRKSDGKILLGYDVVFGVSGYPIGIIQLNENGTYDNTFNIGNGINTYGKVYSICVQSDNNVLVGGYFNSYNTISTKPVFRLRVCSTGHRDTVYACNNYIWNGITYNSSGIYTQTINSINGCSRVDTLQLSVNSAIPTSPTITQTLLSNTCGARVYRYTASSVTNGVGYTWILPTSVGGIAGVVVDSGNINNSRIIKVKFVSNEAAVSGDSVRLRAFSGCGQSAIRVAKLINTKLSIPAAPASITITALQTNVCGARKYRYIAPSLPLATTSATAATGYVWDLIGALKTFGYVIDSGSLNSQKLIITFTSNQAAVAGDSIRVCYTSACGNSPKKAIKLTNSILNPPAAPATITVTALGASTCGQPKYRYTAPSLPLATSTTGAATAYEWSIYGQWQLGVNAILDSGTLTSQKMVIRYLNGNAKIAGDSARCRFASNCGYSVYKTASLSNTALGSTPPAKPISITITVVDTTICGGRKYRYTAPVLPSGTAVYGAATGYAWSLPTTNIGAILDSGTLNSKIILVRYTNNRAAIAGDSMNLQYSSVCGVSPVKSQKLTNLLKSNCRNVIQSNRLIVRYPNAQKEDQLINLYPNPSSCEFNLKFKNDVGQLYQIRVLDMQGRSVLKINNFSAQYPISFGKNLSPGIYILEIRENNRLIETKRLIKSL